MNDETVMVVASNILKKHTTIYRTGLTTDDMSSVLTTIHLNLSYEIRSKAENDDTIKQIIPYALLRCNDKFFVLKRTNKQTESRLHNMCSLGIGGHINPDGNAGNNILINGLIRELNEEVIIECIKSIKLEGIINDETTDVGRHHLGLFYVVETTNINVSINENDKMEGTFVDVCDLGDYYDKMESWSKIIFDTYITKRGA